MISDNPAHALTGLLEAVARGRSLTAEEAEVAFDRFMDGSASEAQMAGLLVGLYLATNGPGSAS